MSVPTVLACPVLLLVHEPLIRLGINSFALISHQQLLNTTVLALNPTMVGTDLVSWVGRPAYRFPDCQLRMEFKNIQIPQTSQIFFTLFLDLDIEHHERMQSQSSSRVSTWQ